MTRKVYYRPDGAFLDVMIGVNITKDLNEKIEQQAETAHRTKSDFLRLLLEEGLKTLSNKRLRVRSTSSEPSLSQRSTGAKRSSSEAGFMLAPLLYMLALGGIGAAVMFSGYSQVLRSNAEMTSINAVRQQLNTAAQTLSAASALDAGTSTILQPPAVYAFGSVSDTARLPTSYASVNSIGTPSGYGVIDTSSGVRQLDPWGKYYVYCRWDSAIATATLPSIMVLSAGPDGVLQTKCGDAAAVGDDRINKLSVAEAVNRANVWQVNSASQVSFGTAANAVKVNDDGSMQAASLTLTTPLAIGSGGTGAATAALARVNLGVPALDGTGATSTWGISITGNAATATALQSARNLSIAGSTGLTAAAASFDGTADVALALTGTLALANGGTGVSATDNADLRNKLGMDNASNLLSGTVAQSRLGSGTADGTTYLRGDGTWATVSGGSGPPSGHAYPHSSGAIVRYPWLNKELGHEASDAGRSVA